MKNLKKVLATIAYKEEWTIRGFIAQEALKRKPNIKQFFKDLVEKGSVSWIIEHLVSYRDNYYFFNQHYREISDALLEYNDEEWFYFESNDLPRVIVWCAVDKIASEMADDDLGLEI